MSYLVNLIPFVLAVAVYSLLHARAEWSRIGRPATALIVNAPWAMKDLLAMDLALSVDMTGIGAGFFKIPVCLAPTSIGHHLQWTERVCRALSANLGLFSFLHVVLVLTACVNLVLLAQEASSLQISARIAWTLFARYVPLIITVMVYKRLHVLVIQVLQRVLRRHQHASVTLGTGVRMEFDARLVRYTITVPTQ